MHTLDAKFEALASQYARKLCPNGKAEQIQSSVRRLRDRIARGELNVEDVCRRLSVELRDPSPNPPPNFGDIARACRDWDSGRLSLRERDFVQQMCALGFARQPSLRQRAWLQAIFTALQPRRAA